MYDTISGIRPDGFVGGEGIPDVVRWAADVYLKVTMDQEELDSAQKLLRPYLVIDYREREVATMTATEQVFASIHVDYFSDYSSTL